MNQHLGYKIEPFSSQRQMVAANMAVASEQNTIHLMTEVDISVPRRLMADHRERTGESLSLTAYLVTCLGRALADFPTFNSFRKGGQLVVFEDATISVAFEREIDGESVPEPVAIQAVNRKTYREVNDELRAFQGRSGEALGTAMGTAWVRFIPDFLLRAFTRLAYREIGVWQRFGVIGVTSVGMFGNGPTWLVPLTSTTVMVAVGSIAKRPTLVDGVWQERDHLCLTFSFNHDLIDGAPAARFTKRVGDILSSGDELRDLLA
ncbi:MAG: 2-oxo acid dehydrogenase subunit E2 [Anaerolineae bacterium]|nr:2-oxo acid dehydrogenase subunit E2 [Anaerolineae bacterium]